MAVVTFMIPAAIRLRRSGGNGKCDRVRFGEAISHFHPRSGMRPSNTFCYSKVSVTTLFQEGVLAGQADVRCLVHRLRTER